MQADFQYAPFLSELGRLADPETPEITSDKDMHTFFAPLVKGKSFFLDIVKGWSAAAASKISSHFDGYLDLGGDVQFT